MQRYLLIFLILLAACAAPQLDNDLDAQKVKGRFLFGGSGFAGGVNDWSWDATVTTGVTQDGRSGSDVSFDPWGGLSLQFASVDAADYQGVAVTLQGEGEEFRIWLGDSPGQTADVIAGTNLETIYVSWSDLGDPNSVSRLSLQNATGGPASIFIDNLYLYTSAPQEPGLQPEPQPEPTPQPDAPANLLYEVGFETGNFSEVNADRHSGVHTGGKNASVTVINNPAKGAGNPTSKVARFQVTQSDERAELRQWRASGLDELWYGWQVFIPEDWQPIKGKHEIVQQWHRKGGIQGTYVAKHPMVLSIKDDGSYGMTYNYSTGNNTRYEGSASLNGSANANSDKDRWVNWAFHVKWAEKESDNGFMRMYHDGELVWEHYGRNWEFVKDSGYPFYMGGIYTGDPGWSGPSRYTIYQDNFRVAEGPATIKDVNPYLR